jgi:hypothetical protein
MIHPTVKGKGVQQNFVCISEKAANKSYKCYRKPIGGSNKQTHNFHVVEVSKKKKLRKNAVDDVQNTRPSTATTDAGFMRAQTAAGRQI